MGNPYPEDLILDPRYYLVKLNYLIKNFLNFSLKGSHHLKKCRILRKTFSNGGGGQSVFLLLFRNGPKWSKMAQMVQKCPK